MKRFNVSKAFGISFLALSLATLPVTLPASAQTNTAPDGTAVDTTTNRPATDGDFSDGDWGLLGLLGLFGLFGRRSRKYDDSVAYDRDVVGTSATRSRY